MDPADLAVFFPFLFLELLNPNLWPAEGAGPTLNLPKNGPRYPPGLKVAKAVPSLRTSGIKRENREIHVAQQFKFPDSAVFSF